MPHSPARRRTRDRRRAPSLRALALLLALVAPTALGLAACDLDAQVGVSADGVADVVLEIGIDRSLIDGDGPTCEQVVDGVLQGIVPTDGADLEVAEVADDSALRCRMTTTLTLGGDQWDGQSGRPLWWADADEGGYRLALPLSQGSGSSGVSQEVADSLGISADDVVLTVTMPADITSATVGTVEGATVTVRGSDVLLRDLDIEAGTRHGPGRGTLVVIGTLGLGAAALGGLALLVRREHVRHGRGPSA